MSNYYEPVPKEEIPYDTPIPKDWITSRDFKTYLRPVSKPGEVSWVKASERLGEFHDSDIPDWKFWNPDFCKLDGKKPITYHFRKDTTKNEIVFCYTSHVGQGASYELPSKDFHRVEWLDESTPAAGKGEQISRDNAYKILQDLWEAAEANNPDWRYLIDNALKQLGYDKSN